MTFYRPWLGLREVALAHLAGAGGVAVRAAAALATHTVLVLADGRVALCGRGGTGPFGNAKPCPIGLSAGPADTPALPLLQHFDGDGDGRLDLAELRAWAASAFPGRPLPGREKFDCHVRKTATEYNMKPGIKWLSCTAKWPSDM